MATDPQVKRNCQAIVGMTVFVLLWLGVGKAVSIFFGLEFDEAMGVLTMFGGLTAFIVVIIYVIKEAFSNG